MSALAPAFGKEKDLQTALRMAFCLANLAYDNDEVFELVKVLECTRPKGLVAADNEQGVQANRDTIDEICDWLGL